MGLRDELLQGKKKIGVWGMGYVGFSSMAYFAKAGVTCIGTDVSQKYVDNINTKKVSQPNLIYWLGFNTGPLVDNGRMRATRDWEALISNDVPVHLIGIPTEKDGKPHHEVLKDVVKKLSAYKNIKTDSPPLVIVESTLTPTVADSIVIPLFAEHGLIVGKDILLGTAPRRDWFTSPEKRLDVLPRVVGGTTKETTRLMAEVLGIICKNVIPAHDHKHAAIVKSIENAYRHLEITFANQLSLAYPDMDITSVLKLAGTKWNIGTFHPSFGTGGYCIPLAPQYVIDGAKHPEELTLIDASLKTDFSQPKRVVDSLIKRGVKKVAVLGIAYTGDLKVHVLCPGITLIKLLREQGIDVIVNDPYYSSAEIKDITGCDAFEFPGGLGNRDAVVIVSPHSKYKYTDTQQIIKNLVDVKFVLDNMGIWNEMELPEQVEYYEAGTANWLE